MGIIARLLKLAYPMLIPTDFPGNLLFHHSKVTLTPNDTFDNLRQM